MVRRVHAPIALAILYLTGMVNFALCAEALHGFVVKPLILGADAHRFVSKNESVIRDVKHLFARESFPFSEACCKLQVIGDARADDIIAILEDCRAQESDIIDSHALNAYRRELNKLMDELSDEDYKVI
ncbi:hypothetical protein LBMAG21_16360 [Armatimonadota bacterium]|nr:hypothetical protein LBMAG21_16360 [Armatimonadota bacterium]